MNNITKFNITDRKQECEKNCAVYYHKADLDGLMSGVIAEYYLKPRYDTVDLIPIDYGDDFIKELPKDEAFYDDIYVIDVSDARLFEVLGHKVCWIDHHISAHNKVISGEIVKPKDTFFINGVSACRLAFRYFTAGPDYAFDDLDFYRFRKNFIEPWVVALAGEYDIWDNTSPLAKRFNFGIPNDFKFVRMLFEKTKHIYAPNNKTQDHKYLEDNKHNQGYDLINYLVTKGEGAIDFIMETDKRVKGQKFALSLTPFSHRYRGIAFNTHIKSSLVHVLQEDEDFTMVWCWDEDKCKVSFYSEGKVDVSQFAGKFGGGGHAGAAGCQMSMFQLLELIGAIK